MSSVFSRSTRCLAEDGFRRSTLMVLLVAALLGAWAVWFIGSRVAIYASTDDARLEVIQAVHPLVSPLTGKVVASRLALGREVAADEALVELDSQPQRLELAEEQALRDSAARQAEVLRKQVAALEQARDEERERARLALEAAKAREREAQATARRADEKFKHLSQLKAAGRAGEQEVLDAEAEARKTMAAAEVKALETTECESEWKVRESDRRSELEKLHSEIAGVEGQITARGAAISRLEHEISRRQIRAPVAGQLGEVAPLRAGEVVIEGAKLAAVVPGGKLMLTAAFEPAAVVGRIHAGQSAWLHLHGFPSIQYGSVPATVTQAGSEIRNGRIRVEFSIQPEKSSRIPFEHGLPGRVEVEVDRISPASLVLRAVGQLLSRREARVASAGSEEASR